MVSKTATIKANTTKLIKVYTIRLMVAMSYALDYLTLRIALFFQYPHSLFLFKTDHFVCATLALVI